MSAHQIFARLNQILLEGKSVVLCTLTKKYGSGPRDEGAKMLVESDGSILGTIGGGSMERLIIDEALEAINEGKSRTINFAMGLEPKEGAVFIDSKCGGEVSIFLDIINPNPRIILIGSGHIAKPVAELAHMTGFEVILIDDALTATDERFPHAVILTGDFVKGINELKIYPSDYLVIVHGETEYELLTLRRFLPENLAYIGLLGSKNKAKNHKEQLLSEGYNPEDIKKLNSPIGIDLGAETPEEIAVSIIAELIRKRRTRTDEK